MKQTSHRHNHEQSQDTGRRSAVASKLKELFGRGDDIGGAPAPTDKQLARIHKKAGGDPSKLSAKEMDAIRTANATSKRARVDALPAGPGLREYVVKLNQFHDVDDYDAVKGGRAPAAAFQTTILRKLEETQEANNEDGSLNIGEGGDVFKSLMYSGLVQSRPTKRLQEWVGENTPVNTYFTPEMVAEAVAGDSRIESREESKGVMRYWHFGDDEGHTLTLSRTADGSKPTERNQPYLAVQYRTDYDEGTREVVSTPRIVTGESFGSRGVPQTNPNLDTKLGAMLQEDLGVHEFRVAQQIDFREVGPKPQPYFRAGEADMHAAFESVSVQRHILADLPESQS